MVTDYVVFGGFGESVVEKSSLIEAQRNIGAAFLTGLCNSINMYKWHDADEGETVTVVAFLNFHGEVFRVIVIEDMDCTCCESGYEDDITFLL